MPWLYSGRGNLSLRWRNLECYGWEAVNPQANEDIGQSKESRRIAKSGTVRKLRIGSGLLSTLGMEVYL